MPPYCYFEGGEVVGSGSGSGSREEIVPTGKSKGLFNNSGSSTEKVGFGDHPIDQKIQGPVAQLHEISQEKMTFV